MVGAQQCLHQREADLEIIVVNDLLVGEEGDWLTMEDGGLRLKRQTRGPMNDPLLDNNETAIASNESFSKWSNPDGPCPQHPSSCHKWVECTLFQECQIIQ